MRKGSVPEICVRFADRVKEALERGDKKQALELIAELKRENKNMHKTLASVIAQSIVPFIQDRFIADQDSLADKIEEAITQGDKNKALALIEARTEKWVKVHDLYVDFWADCFAYIYDSFGKEALFEFYRKWGEQIRPFFEKRMKAPPDKALELGCVMWREQGDTRVSEAEVKKDKCRFVTVPCGSGGRRVEREEKGIAGRQGFSRRMREEFPLTIGARSNIPIYCTHCAFLFETLCKEWFGRPLWIVNPPDKAEDPCIIEVTSAAT